MKKYIKSATDAMSERAFLEQVCVEASDQLSATGKAAKPYIGRIFDIIEVEFAAYNLSYMENVSNNILAEFYDSQDVAGAVNYLLDALQQGQDSNKFVFEEDYVIFLESYRPYFNKIAEIVSEIAQQNDSDMTYDIDGAVADSESLTRGLVVELMSDKPYMHFNHHFVTITYALGLPAINPKPLELPTYYLNDGQKIRGPVDINYKNNNVFIYLDKFDKDCNKLRIALQEYFARLAHTVTEGDESYWTPDGYYLDDSKRRKWSSVIAELRSDIDNGVDPLYAQTSAGDYISDTCEEVEDAMHIWIEPSIQGGVGGIWIYDSNNNDETIVSDYDYETYNSEVLDIAMSSKNKTEFKRNYKAYLKDLISR